MADSKNILIVEDDDQMRHILKETCEKQGWEVLEAADGEEGVDKAIDKKPGLVLLDLLLPKLDGFGFLKKIRRHGDPEISGMPVIVLSNLYSNKDILAAETLTIEAYFVKANTSLDQVVDKAKQVLK